MVCLICGENKHDYLYMLHGIPLWQCSECGLVSSQLHFSEKNALGDYKNRNESFPVATEGRTETEASKRYLEILKSGNPNATRIILLAKPNHVFSKVAKELGLQVVQHLTISEFENRVFTEESVDAVIFIYQLEKSLFPQNVLNKAHDLLKPDGTLLVVTPSLDSRSARFFKNAWTEWRPENLYYFDNTTIQSLLWKQGFNEIRVDKDLRSYTLAHINDRVASFPKTWITRSINLAYQILPSSLHGIYFRLPTSGRVISAKKSERHNQQVLSIVLPVYNESSTFPELIKQLISKQIDCVEKEIIIVESNSTDNSRQLVMEYKDHPGVKIILQDKPRGKGYAVREGFEQASGDVLMIQDADLEYDLNDYDALLEPVVTYKRPCVLGSRHGGRWKMRHFNEQEHISAYFNFGHKLFTTLINVLYGQKMKDPFTMFKVFRHDCLYNLKFECNRFDFDFELVIKLIRKGYTPLEIPVNYNSRSFKEGKKVNMFRDPLTWLKASFKYRFVKITKD
jgi:SAM-dependent methyltransferase